MVEADETKNFQHHYQNKRVNDVSAEAINSSYSELLTASLLITLKPQK